MYDGHERPEGPINPVPWIVWVLFAGVAGVEIVLGLADAGMIGGPGGIGWRVAAMQDWAFSPAVWDYVWERGRTDPGLLRRFIGYAFVHGSFTQALFGGALLLALGKFVGDVFAWWAVLAVFVVSAVVGAVAFGILAEGTVPLIGVYPAVYGLIGAFSYLMWLQLGVSGQNRAAAFRLIGFLLGIQLVFGLIFGGPPTWIDDVSGFAAGFAISSLLAPGGWTASVRRMRAR